jgi:hypothetical protein
MVALARVFSGVLKRDTPLYLLGLYIYIYMYIHISTCILYVYLYIFLGHRHDPVAGISSETTDAVIDTDGPPPAGLGKGTYICVSICAYVYMDKYIRSYICIYTCTGIHINVNV